MATRPLPKPAAERTLQKKYRQLAVDTKGRLDVSTEQGAQLSKLLHTYCAAFCNLYGTIPVRAAWDILRESEPALIGEKKLLKKDFLAFTDILRAEMLPYYVLESDELYSEEPAGKPIDREFVSKALVQHGQGRFSDYDMLLDAQADKPFCLMERDELLAWADAQTFFRSPQAVRLRRFLDTLRVSRQCKNKDVHGDPIRGKQLNQFIFWSDSESFYYTHAKRDWERQMLAAEYNVTFSEKLMRRITRSIQLGSARVPMTRMLEWRVRELNEVGVLLTQDQFSELVRYMMEYNNKSHLWCNRGWTPEELSAATARTGAPEITFGPGIRAAFESGEMDKAELLREFAKRGFRVSDD